MFRADSEIIAALLTRFKPEGKEKFTIRPYTPTSDEGMIPPALVLFIHANSPFRPARLP